MWNDALPRNGITNWSVFYAGTTSIPQSGWYSWTKPAGCSWIYFFCVGAGGGGANPGGTGITVGGGGGASGPVTRILIPASLLPDIIYVRPATGGAGAAPSSVTNGSGGATSFLSIAPNTTAQNLILTLSGGNPGASAGTGGGSGNITTSASGIWLNVGLFTSIATQAGGAGAAAVNTVGSDVTFGASGLPITGGAGGGNGSGTGGNIIGAGLMPSRNGGVGTTGGNGDNGFRIGQTFAPGFKMFPLLFSGGAGGGGAISGNLGKGGNGAYGCGGGGGGGGGSGTSGGGGGNGGDALILIGAF